MKGINKYLFPAGIAVVVLGSAIGIAEDMIKILAAVMGIAIGYLNVNVKERIGFLLSTTALAILGTGILKVIPAIGGVLVTITEGVVVLASGAAIFIALLSIYEYAKD